MSVSPSFGSVTPPLRVEDVDAEVARLEGHWEAGRAGGAGARRSVTDGLEALRQLWRARPALFRPASVEALKILSAALRAPAPARAGAAPLEVLKTTFGYDRFRPGQEE